MVHGVYKYMHIYTCYISSPDPPGTGAKQRPRALKSAETLLVPVQLCESKDAARNEGDLVEGFQPRGSKYSIIIHLPKSCTTITITKTQVPNYWALGPLEQFRGL